MIKSKKSKNHAIKYLRNKSNDQWTDDKDMIRPCIFIFAQETVWQESASKNINVHLSRLTFPLKIHHIYGQNITN